MKDNKVNKNNKVNNDKVQNEIIITDFPKAFALDPFMPPQKECFSKACPRPGHLKSWSILALILNFSAVLSLLAKSPGPAFLMCLTGLLIIFFIFSKSFISSILFRLTFIIDFPYKAAESMVTVIFALPSLLFWACFNLVFNNSGVNSKQFNRLPEKSDFYNFKLPFENYSFETFFWEGAGFLQNNKKWFILPCLIISTLCLLLIFLLPENSSISTFVYNLSTAAG